MNKTYRSIWNASLGCYVAAPESAVSHGAGTSRARAERAELPKQSGSAMVMEARIVFDGALLVTAIEQDSTVPAAEAPVAEAPVADHPADHPADTTTVATAEPTVTAPTDTTATAPAATTTDTGSTTEPAATTDTKAAATTEVSTAADTAPAPLAVIAPAAASSHEIVFVDSRVPDISAFQGQGREVVVLTLEQDGLSQIADALAGRSDVDAIHIVSHGSDGVLTLGSTEVTTESIQSTQLAYLQSIGQSLTADGDILIYACDYAAGSTGLAAMDLLADITGADVAASTDTTGNAAQGGDWTLEQSTGTVDVQAIDLPSWQGELATYTGSVLASHLTISGSATSVSSDTIRLTPNTQSQSGAAQSTFEVALNTDFSLSFSVYLGTSDAGADGVTFIMHNDPAGAQALGVMGGGLGAQGIVDGVVIEFDTYYNGAPDLVNDHTAMWDSDNMSDILVGASDLGNIENGTWYPVTVTWTASTQTLSYTFNGVSMGSASGLVSAGRFGSGDTVHFGWTGATGGAMNDQEVRITSFTGAINFAPDAVNDTVTVNEEGATPLGNLMGNDSDTEGGPMSISPNSTTGSAGGTIFQDDSGNLVFAPGSAFNDLAVGQSRTTSFSYTLTDDQCATDTATVTVTVQGANDAPVAVGDAFDVSEEGAAWLGNPLANDSDPDSSNLGMVLNGTTGSNGGSFGTDDSGNLIFVAGSAFDDLAVGQSRQTSITYTVSDAQGAQAIGTVTVTVHGANDAPVGANDAFSVYEDDAVQLGHITANDSDIDGGVVSTSTAVVQAGDNGGVFSFDDAGNLIFNPNGEFNSLGEGQSRSTSFQYTLSDGQGGSSVATVTVTVQGIDDAPVAGDDAFIADEDMPLALGSLQANDSDVDAGDSLSLSAVLGAGSAGGTLFADDSGALFFIAGSDFDDLQVGQSRDTSFTYAAYDSHGSSDTATVTITVQGVNDAPVTANDVFDADEEGAVLLGDLLANDSDPDTSTLTMTLDSDTGSSGGSFGTDDAGNLIFAAGSAFDNLAVGQTRETSITYTVSDGDGARAVGTVTITVHGVNDAPVGVNDDFSVYEDAAVMLGSVTANDSDVDGGVVMADTAAVHGGDNGGVFSFDDAGNLIFNPQGDFNGLGEGQSRSTSFQYTLGDGQGGSSLATVTITVQGINDAPVGGDDTFIADEDTPLALGSLLANDSDVDDGDTLSQSALLGAGSGGGTLCADDSGALYFIAGSDFDDLQVGQSRDTGFTYVVSDDHGGSAEAQVTVTVMGVNDAPVGVADAYDADANVATVLGNPADNDTDVEGDSLGVVPFVETAGSNGGLFGIDDSGRLVFNPAGDFDDLAEGQSCDTSFTYAVQDGNGGVSYAVATVTVHGVAVTPVEPTHPNEIVFVDSRVPDPQSFATGGREVVVLTLDQDGLVQMAAALSGRSGVAAVHIVSHGGDGYLTVGNANIDADSVQSYHLAALQTLATSLSADGDILIYACDFASSANAQNVLQLLAQYTSADVAASTDTTGDASLGGDWVLEATVGTVDASTLAPANWVHTLNVGKPEGVAVDKQVAQINLISHTDPETKMASAGGTAEPVRVQRMQALEAVLRNSVDQSVAVAAPVTPVAVETVAPQAEPAIRVVTSTDADAADHPVAHSGPWALTDSSPIYSALDASDALDVGDGAGAALGLRAQLSRWSAGFGQRPLTRGALRA